MATACGDDGNAADVVVSSVDFGHTDCGTQAVTRSLTLSNESGEAFNFTTSLAAGPDSMYVVTPAAGAVLAGSQLTIEIISKPIPAESAVTDNLYGDTLTISTDKDGDKSYDVAITQTARGVLLQAAAPAVNFGTPLQAGMSADMPLMITNIGNVSAEVSVVTDLPPAFTISQGAALTIAPGASAPSTIKFSPGHTTENLATATITAASTVPVCSKPIEVALSGIGTATGMAAHAVPSALRGRMRDSGGIGTICTLLTNGMVACGGDNFNGVRGATNEYMATIPHPESGKGGGGPSAIGGLDSYEVVNFVQTKTGYLDGVIQLVSGVNQYCARRAAGDVWCWGDIGGIGGRARQFNPTVGYHPHATRVISAGASNVALGYHHRCVTMGASNAFSCESERSGTNSTISTSGWIGTNVTSMGVNGGNSFAVVGGEVFTFGRNGSGERGYSANQNDPGAKIPSFTNVVQVVAGGRGVNRDNRWGCARKDDGSVWCWGDNRHGQLGDGTGSNNQTPVQVRDEEDTNLSGVTSITSGNSHACALISGGVWCWGRGEEGQMGNNGILQENPKALEVTGLSTVSKVEASGTRATCAVLANGSVRCWGHIASRNYLLPTAVAAFEP